MITYCSLQVNRRGQSKLVFQEAQQWWWSQSRNWQRVDLKYEQPIKTKQCFSSHSALSSYELFAPLALWRLSVSLRPLIQALGNCPASGAPWSSAMPPSIGRGRVTTTNNASSIKKSMPLNLKHQVFVGLYNNNRYQSIVRL